MIRKSAVSLLLGALVWGCAPVPQHPNSQLQLKTMEWSNLKGITSGKLTFDVYAHLKQEERSGITDITDICSSSSLLPQAPAFCVTVHELRSNETAEAAYRNITAKICQEVQSYHPATATHIHVGIHLWYNSPGTGEVGVLNNPVVVCRK